MELKHRKSKQDGHDGWELLIVPYGIETCFVVFVGGGFRIF